MQQKSKKNTIIIIYILQEQYHGGSSRVVFASERLAKVVPILREKYGLDDDNVRHFLEWKEFYNVCEDVKIFVESIRMDRFVEYEF